MDIRNYPGGKGDIKGRYSSGNMILRPGLSGQQMHYGENGVGGLAVYFQGTLAYKQAYWDGTDLWRVKGKSQVHNRGLGTTIGTDDAYALQVKSEFNDTDAAHACLEVTCDWRANGTTGGGIRGVQGVARVATGYTLGGTANLIGTYGQVAAVGTVNGSGRHAALYGLIEAGGTWTSVSRLAVAWLDSHLVSAPGAGELNFLEISNNAAAVFNSAIRIYPGNAITNLFDIETASGMIGANQAGGGTLNFTNYRLVTCELEGETYYLLAAKTIA
jgi:hypothetical protein